MQPLVSVVMPMFNAGPYVAQAISSVRSQTHVNWELIIVDNSSTDGSREVVRREIEGDGRVRLIELPSNSGGPALPRNIGIKESRGEFIAFLDADDAWESQKLEKQVRYLKDSPGVALCYTPFRVVRDGVVSGAVLPKRSRLKAGDAFDDLFLSFNFIACSSVMIRAERAAQPLFDESAELVAIEDFDMWLRISRNGKIGFVDEPLLFYRVHGSNTSGGAVKSIILNWRLIRNWRGRVGAALLARKYLMFFAYGAALLLREALGMDPKRL